MAKPEPRLRVVLRAREQHALFLAAALSAQQAKEWAANHPNEAEQLELAAELIRAWVRSQAAGVRRTTLPRRGDFAP